MIINYKLCASHAIIKRIESTYNRLDNNARHLGFTRQTINDLIATGQFNAQAEDVRTKIHSFDARRKTTRDILINKAPIVGSEVKLSGDHYRQQAPLV